MRIHRIVTAVVAFALLGFVPVLIGAGAGAAGAAQAGSADAATALQARRKIAVKGKEPRPNVFFISGRVKPDYKKKKAFMMKKVGTGSFRKGNKFRTDKRSRFKVRVAGPPRGVKRVCYRVMIPSGGGFKKSQSKALCVVRL